MLATGLILQPDAHRELVPCSDLLRRFPHELLHARRIVKRAVDKNILVEVAAVPGSVAGSAGEVVQDAAQSRADAVPGHPDRTSDALEERIVQRERRRGG